jgi:hypothetical protein
MTRWTSFLSSDLSVCSRLSSSVSSVSVLDRECGLDHDACRPPAQRRGESRRGGRLFFSSTHRRTEDMIARSERTENTYTRNGESIRGIDIYLDHSYAQRSAIFLTTIFKISFLFLLCSLIDVLDPSMFLRCPSIGLSRVGYSSIL